MKNVLMLLAVVGVLCSCDYEDPGPIQEDKQDYDLVNFDRLEVSGDFVVNVSQRSIYNIEVSGDSRNLDELEIIKMGNTVVIRYKEPERRNHKTYIDITMPSLLGIHQTGGSDVSVQGFESDDVLSINLSGGALCQVEAGYRVTEAILSGGSNLVLTGLGDQLIAELSGASLLEAFNYPVSTTTINVSGASAHVTTSDELDVTASSSSVVVYRGNPSLQVNVSGASRVIKD